MLNTNILISSNSVSISTEPLLGIFECFSHDYHDFMYSLFHGTYLKRVNLYAMSSNGSRSSLDRIR